jgi:hypothetical protein
MPHKNHYQRLFTRFAIQQLISTYTVFVGILMNVDILIIVGIIIVDILIIVGIIIVDILIIVSLLLSISLLHPRVWRAVGDQLLSLAHGVIS